MPPAYDIVPTIAYLKDDSMALKLAGRVDPKTVTVARIGNISNYLKIDSQLLEREVRTTVKRILDTWREAVKELPASKPVNDSIFDHWKNLALVNHVRPALV